jgi:hypothetical protein
MRNRREGEREEKRGGKEEGGGRGGVMIRGREEIRAGER